MSVSGRRKNVLHFVFIGCCMFRHSQISLYFNRDNKVALCLRLMSNYVSTVPTIVGAATENGTMKTAL
jgi:hypothetical protein